MWCVSYTQRNYMSLTDKNRAITHVVDNTPYKACVCIYLISLECIPILQGQDASMVWEGLTPNCGCSSSKVHEKPLKHIVCTIYFHHAR